LIALSPRPADLECLRQVSSTNVIVRGNQRRKTIRCDKDYKAYVDHLEHYRAIFRTIAV